MEESTVADGPPISKFWMPAPAGACPRKELEGVPQSSGGRELITGIGGAIVIGCGGHVWESSVVGWGMSYLSVLIDTNNPLLNTFDS